MTMCRVEGFKFKVRVASASIKAHGSGSERMFQPRSIQNPKMPKDWRPEEPTKQYNDGFWHFWQDGAGTRSLHVVHKASSS